MFHQFSLHDKETMCDLQSFSDRFFFFVHVLPVFLSSQIKLCAIISYKHGIYELPHELPNELRLRILGN